MAEKRKQNDNNRKQSYDSSKMGINAKRQDD